MSCASRPSPLTLEDKLPRDTSTAAWSGCQSKLNDVVIALCRTMITGFVRGIFAFFFTLMIAAFILIPISRRCTASCAGLFPTNTREDYDIQIRRAKHRSRPVGRDPRGQLLICVHQRRASRSSASRSSG